MQEVHVNLHQRDPLWRETADRRCSTLTVTNYGLLGIWIESVVVQPMTAIQNNAAETPEPKQSTLRAGTKQAMLIALLQSGEDATI